MLQKATTTAIILNYNGGQAVVRCIESLRASESVPEIVVVDNASTDGSLEHLRSLFPSVTFLANERNLGFAAGMNVGIRFALEHGAEFLWLLNNDASVFPTALGELLKRAESLSTPVFFSPAIYKEDGETPWFLAGKISYLRMRTEHIPPQREEIFYPSEYLTGCALFLSRTAVESIGYLDERYFLYYEDAAYSVAAREKGIIPYVVKTARVLHSEQSEKNPEKIYWLVRSGVLFFRTMSPWYWQPWITLYLSLRQIKNRVELLLSPTPVAESVRRAYTDASYV